MIILVYKIKVELVWSAVPAPLVLVSPLSLCFQTPTAYRCLSCKDMTKSVINVPITYCVESMQCNLAGA